MSDVCNVKVTLGLALSISSTASSPPRLRSTSVTSDISVIVACDGMVQMVANAVADTVADTIANKAANTVADT